jgi:hypothetical protein
MIEKKTKKMISNVIEREITAKATNHYHYLQAFGDRFAAFRTKLIV